MVARQPLIDRLVDDELAASATTRPPVDLDRIAGRHALGLRREATLPAGVRARYRKEWGEIAVMDLDPVVERFAIAHELGHAILDHGDRSCYNVTPATEAVALEDADVGVPFEAEANAFAGRLLVPPSWLRAAVAEGQTIAQLQETFLVTKPVLWIAIERAKLINKVSTG